MIVDQATAIDDQDGEKRLRDRFGFVIGVGGTIFGIVTVFGLTLLPASTRSQQVLILGACVTLSAACITGLGAWRSATRFTFTILLMMATLLSIAGLSIVTESVASKARPGDQDNPTVTASPTRAPLPRQVQHKPVTLRQIQRR